MPVRKRAGREKAHRITPEAVEAFIEAQRGRERYISCIRGEGCRSTSASERCGECRAHLDASLRLYRALGLRPWQTSPLDVHPDWSCPWPSGAGAEAWPLALELREQLLEAAEGCRP